MMAKGSKHHRSTDFWSEKGMITIGYLIAFCVGLTVMDEVLVKHYIANGRKLRAFIQSPYYYFQQRRRA
jgi:hypothetical protein